MKFTIGDKIVGGKPATYSITITTMGGDADYYESVTIKDFDIITDVELLKDLVQTLKDTKAEFPHGRGGCDDYTNKRFRAWFEDDNAETAEDIEAFLLRSGQYPEFPVDFSQDHSWQTIDSWQVTYYDENSQAYEVEILEN